MSELPEWALKHLPVDHPQAALLLGVSERKLWALLKEHPHFERRGRKNVYYPEHIEELRRVTAQPGPVVGVTSDAEQKDRIAAKVAAAKAKRRKT